MTWDERLTIRGRLFLLLLALALPFWIHVTVSIWRQAGEQRAEAQQRMLGIARLTAARLDDHVGDIKQLLSVLAQLVDPQEGATAANDELLRLVAATLPPQINNLSVWSRSGANVGALDDRVRKASPNIAARSAFQAVMRGEELGVEGPVVAATNGKPVGVFMIPVLRHGTVVGAVVAETRLSNLQTLLLPPGGLPAGALVTVIAPAGSVIARSIDPERWIGRSVRSGRSASDPEPDGVRDGPSADGIERIAGFTTASRVPWRVFVGVPTDEALAPVRERLVESLLVGVAMFVAGLIAAARVGSRISGPLRQLGEDAAALELGDMAHRSRVRQGGELGRLAATLNRMSEALQERGASLESSQAQLREITDNLPVLISYIDRDRRFRFANRVYKDWLGIDMHDLVGRSLAEVYGEEAYARFRHHIDAGLAGGRVVYERDLASLAGPRRVEVTLVPHAGAAKTVAGLFVLMQDVTAHRDAVALHRRSEERLMLALEGSGSALFDWDIARDVVHHGPQVATLRGHPAREETTSTAALCSETHPDDRNALRACFDAVTAGTAGHFESNLRLRTRAGGWIWLRASGRVVERDATGRARRLAGTYADVDARTTAEARLRQLAECDALTGLPNRAVFNDRLAQALERRAAPGATLALLVLDIDHFRAVNEAFGHDAGDAALIDVARTLQHGVRACDTVARRAGSEFTVLLEGLRDATDAESMAQTLIDRARRSVGDAARSVPISISVGIALAAPADREPLALLHRADTALRRARRLGRDRFASAVTVAPAAPAPTEAAALPAEA